MQCFRCQHENRATARFCEACGSSLDLRCPSCDNEARPGAAFCGSCGSRLTGQPSALGPARPVTLSSTESERKPLSYTPQYLAEKILTSRIAPEGERKQITVMFADIKDSTELIKGLDPEAARQLTQPIEYLSGETNNLRSAWQALCGMCSDSLQHTGQINWTRQAGGLP